ncbi:MAG: ATP-binding protein [Planctomycetota bacterium]
MPKPPVFYFTPGNDFLADIIATRFRNNGHEVVMATTVEFEQRLRAGYFRVAVIDSAHKDAFGAAAFIKLRAPQTRVLMLLTPEKVVPTEFRFGGDAALIEPFEVSEVVTAVEELMTQDGRAVSASFPTSDENIEHAKTMLTTLLEGIPSLDEAERFQLHVAFGEAVANAALHGNKSRRDKLVKLLWYNDQNGITLRVTDEGPGFDWKSQLAKRSDNTAIDLARERGGEGKLGGLGMNTMKKVCDLVKYNESGNEVTLMKVLTPPLV